MADFIPSVAASALASFDVVMDHLGMGQGKNQGQEYLALNPKRTDGKLGSLSTNRETGAGGDFATGETWGDLVAMTAWRYNCTQLEAAERLAGLLGIPIPQRHKGKAGGAAPSPQRPIVKPAAKPRKADDGEGWEYLPTLPHDMPAPPVANPRQGKPARRYEYRHPDGSIGFYVDRYQTPGGKSFAQLTPWKNAAGVKAWRWKAPPVPRLLYGLDDLASRPDAPVMVCEGEKAREAARTLAPDWVVVSWPGGANAWDKADWSPLGGRDVTLWPDLDEPGVACMAQVAALLAKLPIPPSALYQVKPQAFGLTTPGDDAADLLGWDAARYTDVCTREAWREPLAIQTPKASPAAPRRKADTAKGKAIKASPGTAPRTFYSLDTAGVHFNDTDREGNPNPPKWVCSYLEPLARVRNPDNQGWGLLVKLYDADMVAHRLVIPMALFNGEGLEVARILLDRGLSMAPGSRQRVVAYLQTSRPEARARITPRTGWHGAGDGRFVFVLPDRALGAQSDEEWLYEAESSAAHAYKVKGSPEEWREHVGRLCRGNSRLLFAVSVAFASPLLHLVGGESGGFHFRSNSSDGKTTCLRVACSVCGGSEYMQRWRATDNGLEALATQHCDALLALDELAQLEPRVAGETAYMLANGSGKARAGRTGGARDRASWRVLFLSAGEISLAMHMAEANRTTRAGQEIRMADIPADAGAGLGAWENLHGHANGADFAKAIESAAKRFHGATLGAYLERLTRDHDAIPEQLRQAQKRFVESTLTDGSSGQARRVADRFALVGMGGELATAWGLTGWEQGEAMKAALTCFGAWVKGRGGDGNQEETAIIHQVREFLERYGDGAFDLWHRIGDDRSARTSDRCGVRRWLLPDGTPVAKAGQIENGSDGAEFSTEYFIFDGPWRTRVCKGYDPKTVAALLSAKGYLKTNNGRLQAKVRIPGQGQIRVYHVLPNLFEEE